MNKNAIKDKFSNIKDKLQCGLENLNDLYSDYGKGPLIFLCLFLLVISVLCGTTITTGLGVFTDALILCLIVLSVFLGVYFLVQLVLWLIKIIEGKIIALFIAALVLILYLLDKYTRFPDYLNVIIAISIVLVQVMLGMAIYILYKNRKLKLIPVIILIITVSIDIGGFYWILGPGKKDDTISRYLNSEQYTNYYDSHNNMSNFEELTLEGNYVVNKLFYGSGEDKRRDYYGEEVDIKTNTVSTSSFLENYKGFKSKLREIFWGFSQEEMPLNAVVWFPDKEGNYPITFILHGNHSMEDYSELGYEYLGKFLASKGYIVVSIDENFLNGSWSGDLGKENDARAWMLLKHIELWHEFNEDENSPFYKNVDLNNIGLIGHSRGGESVVLASYFNDKDNYEIDENTIIDFDFDIKSVATIAPSDGQYKPNNRYSVPKNVDFLSLQGASDADISNFVGSNVYDRVEFNDGQYHFKSYLYILGANHGQFNSSWGSFDSSSPSKVLINRANLINKEEQEEIAKIYLGAFLDCTLKGKSDYLELFKDHTVASEILPATVYYSKFEDTTNRMLADFEEDNRPSTTTIKKGYISSKGFVDLKEDSLEFKDEDKRKNDGVFLKWSEPNANYSIDISDSNIALLGIKENDMFSFSACDIDEDKLNIDVEEVIHTDFIITLTDKENNSSNIKFSDYYLMPPPIRLNVTKLEFYDEIKYGTNIDQILQSYTIPLKDFIKTNPSLNLDELAGIEFSFEGKGNIVLDDIGIIE